MKVVSKYRGSCGYNFIVVGVGLAAIVTTAYSTAGPCHESYPCDDTYPTRDPSDGGDFIEVGILHSVDLNSTRALATRALIEVTFDEINADPDILPGIQFIGVWGAHGGVSEAGGFFSVLQSALADGNVFNVTLRVPLILGPRYSAVAKPASISASRLDVAILGATASSPSLSNEELYPTFSRVYPSDDAAGAIVARLLKGFGYTKVGVLVRNDVWGVGISVSFAKEAKQIGLEILSMAQFDESVPADVEVQMDVVKQSLARVIVAFVFDHNQLLEIADHLEMTSPKYQFIGADGLLTHELLDRPELRASAVGTLVLFPLVDEDSDGFQRLKSNFDAKYAADPSSTYNTQFSDLPVITKYFYDCIMFGAKALHELNSAGHDLKTLSQTQVTNQLRNQTMSHGLTGFVDLKDDGDRIGSYEVLNYQRMDDGSYAYITVGHYIASFEPVGNAEIIWSTGTSVQPKDSVSTENMFLETSNAAVVSLQALASIGLIACFVALAFNLKFRNLLYIKMSSPTINSVILAGCALAYSSIFLLAIHNSTLSDSGFTAICHLRVSVLMLSFTFAFGGLFAKTWRVFRIFFNKTLTKVTITNIQLLRVVFILLFFDLLIIFTWIAWEPMSRDRVFLHGFEDPNDSDNIIFPVVDSCSSPHMGTLVGIVIAYKGLVIIGGAVLAILTRDVNIQALNDSRQIGLCIYTVALVTVIVVPMMFFVESGGGVTATFLFGTLAIWFNTSSVIVLLFVTKMYAVATGTHAEHTKTTIGKNSSVSRSQAGGSGVFGKGVMHKTRK